MSNVKILKYPFAELLMSVVVVIIAALLPWQTASQRYSMVLFTAFSVVVALVWHFAVKATPFSLRWCHLLLGVVLLVVEWFIFGKQETGILDILLVPVGLGIIIAALSSYVRAAR